uniref:Putative secreted protein n=1 Tax=Ixodes ricinus TaxID=34613 RepID=A0A6B0U3P1_IXORI
MLRNFNSLVAVVILVIYHVVRSPSCFVLANWFTRIPESEDIFRRICLLFKCHNLIRLNFYLANRPVPSVVIVPGHIVPGRLGSLIEVTCP